MASPSEKLVAHLSRPRALQLLPGAARLARCRGFDIDTRRILAPRRQPLEEGGQRILPEGRIEEHHIEPLARAREVGERLVVHQLHRAGTDGRARRLQCAERGSIGLHHHHAHGAARRRLEAEGTGAGEKIEATLAVEPLSQPIEERLAPAIGRRPQSGARCDADASPAVLASDDAHQPFARMHRSMVAALSWAARLKNGLARTRDVLNTPVSELFVRRRVDESLFEDLETALLQADCGVAATDWLLTSLREKARKDRIEDAETLKRALKDSVTELLQPLERRLDTSRARPFTVMIAGVNVSGKTTSIGKLAKWLQSQGKSVVLAAGDPFRAAAREQLVVWGERNNVPVIAQAGGDPGAVVYDALAAARARGVDVVIADTAGRLPTQLHLMEEIRKVKRVAGKAQAGAPHEVLLVLDANTGQNAVAQVKAFDDALKLTGLIITKLDGTAKGGAICAIAKERPVPVLFVGVGENIDDLRPFSAREFAEALIG